MNILTGLVIRLVDCGRLEGGAIESVCILFRFLVRRPRGQVVEVEE